MKNVIRQKKLKQKYLQADENKLYYLNTHPMYQLKQFLAMGSGHFSGIEIPEIEQKPEVETSTAYKSRNLKMDMVFYGLALVLGVVIVAYNNYIPVESLSASELQFDRLMTKIDSLQELGRIWAAYDIR